MEKDEENLQKVLERINNYPENYRALCHNIHKIIMETNLSLKPRLWYGMPGYALKKDQPVLFYFRPDKYVSFGLTDSASINKIGNIDGDAVAVAWYLTNLNSKIQSHIENIVKLISLPSNE